MGITNYHTHELKHRRTYAHNPHVKMVAAGHPARRQRRPTSGARDSIKANHGGPLRTAEVLPLGGNSAHKTQKINANSIQMPITTPMIHTRNRIITSLNLSAPLQ